MIRYRYACRTFGSRGAGYDSANPVFVAADLLSQAEHELIAGNIDYDFWCRLQAAVVEEVERQLAELPRREIAEKSLADSKLILVNTWMKR